MIELPAVVVPVNLGLKPLVPLPVMFCACPSAALNNNIVGIVISENNLLPIIIILLFCLVMRAPEARNALRVFRIAARLNLKGTCSSDCERALPTTPAQLAMT